MVYSTRKMLIPALASASHTRAGAPGRLARQTANCGAVSMASLGCAFMLRHTDALAVLLTTDETALAEHENDLGAEPWMFGILE
jgi:hypothetical protein